MSIDVVSESFGQYGISTGFDRKHLGKLSSDSKTKSIQFASPLTDREVDLLETIVFSKRPDILLRVWEHIGKSCDLGFVERIPSLRKFSADCLFEATGIESVSKLKHLEVFRVGIDNLENFDFLDKINPGIKELYLHATNSKKPEISIIGKFSELTILYLDGQQKGIEAINRLHKLKDVTLRSISTDNITYLAGLKDLWSVDIKLGGIKSFDALSTLPNLKYLELWQIKGLSDLSFISELVTLQNLFIQSLRQVKELPSFDKSISLRRIFLENLKGLTDLASLKTAPVLQEFAYTMAGNQEVENVIPVLQNPTVQKVLCGFSSEKKYNQFIDLIAKYKKKVYSHSDFTYV